MESDRFFIVTEDDDLNYTNSAKRLRRFLLKKAQTKTKNVDSAAQALGISRQTYYTWLAETERATHTPQASVNPD
ncbi:MAG: hypothetical protein HYZ37_11930 [Candidatus Solibacter usitatus]|nr:hypothetical protein [Candidatus Solibacter usitatus]